MDIPNLYEDIVKSVLSVVTDEGSGTGFFVRADGLLLTNRHVVGTNRKVQLQAKTGPSFEGEVILSDRERDLCGIRVMNLGNQTLPFLKIGDSSKARIGDTVFAIGNPSESAAFSLAKGIVSAVSHRKENLSFLQASISINWGNSGGPLFQENEMVIGMVTQLGFTPEDLRVEGLCLAIPSEAMEDFMVRIPPFNEDFMHLFYCQICGNLEEKSQYCAVCGVPQKDQLGSSGTTKKRSGVDGATRRQSEVCQSCKTSNLGGNRYCQNCGSDLRS